MIISIPDLARIPPYLRPVKTYEDDYWKIANSIVEMIAKDQLFIKPYAAAKNIIFDEIEEAIRELGFPGLTLDRSDLTIYATHMLYYFCCGIAGDDTEYASDIFYAKLESIKHKLQERHLEITKMIDSNAS
jgi:hypothetical protein